MSGVKFSRFNLFDGITYDYVSDFCIGFAKINAKFFLRSIIFDFLLTFRKIQVVCCRKSINYEMKFDVLGSLRRQKCLKIWKKLRINCLKNYWYYSCFQCFQLRKNCHRNPWFSWPNLKKKPSRFFKRVRSSKMKPFEDRIKGNNETKLTVFHFTIYCKCQIIWIHNFLQWKKWNKKLIVKFVGWVIQTSSINYDYWCFRK